MSHTLLENEWIVKTTGSSTVISNTAPKEFLKNIFGITTEDRTNADNLYPINNNGHVGFICHQTSSNYNTAIAMCDKLNNKSNNITHEKKAGTIFYQISSGETVKYFKYVQSDESAENSYTYIIAEDANGEWVLFNNDKMFSEYGITGIYTNPQFGTEFVVDGNNQFMIAEAYRFDTGVKFKELFFVLSATAYTDTNCIIQRGDKTYRLVSVSNVKDESGRYPAFAFPVSN